MTGAKTGVILECALDEAVLADATIDVRAETVETPFGRLDYRRLESEAGEALVFENGGMNGRRTFARAALPVFTVAHREGVDSVFALGFAGALDDDLSYGEFTIPEDFLDRTSSRPRSFVEALSPGELFFYRMAEPFSPSQREYLAETVEGLGHRVRDGLVHAVTEGPGFETAAEITVLDRAGADTVSFSGVPDAFFARETGIEYVLGSFVSNAGEGLDAIDTEHVLDAADEQGAFLTEITLAIASDPYEPVAGGFHDEYWMQTPDDGWDDDVWE
jgi:purine nucleoside phosphorylase